MTSLCTEIDSLCEEARRDFYDALLFYGEAESASGSACSEGDAQIAISRALPLLQRICSFHEHCQDVVANAFAQLAALYVSGTTGGVANNRVIVVGADTHLKPLHERLEALYVTLITLDDIVSGNAFLSDHWSAYLRMVRAAALDPTRFGVDGEKMRRLEKVLDSMGEHLFGQKLFRVIGSNAC